jgi:hypothetical protein
MSASTDPPSLPRNGDTRTCPMCNRQVRARVLVCRFCGANMLLERSEQPAMIAQRRRRHQRARSPRTLIALLIICMASIVAGWIVKHGTPTCGSRITGIGVISCSRITTEDRIALLAAINRSSDAARATRTRRAACTSALADSIEAGTELRAGSFAACMRARRTELLRAARTQDSVFTSISAYASGACRTALLTWNTTSTRHIRLTHRAASLRVNPAAGADNLHRISMTGTQAESAAMDEFAARRRLLDSC